jgi:hypothetical protein
MVAVYFLTVQVNAKPVLVQCHEFSNVGGSCGDSEVRAHQDTNLHLGRPTQYIVLAYELINLTMY